VNDLGVEDVVSSAVRASRAHVLLAEALDVSFDVVGSLSLIVSELEGAVSSRTSSYQLLSKRHLLELHLVDSGLSGAKQRSCSEESALHDGRRV
jgi:hypothetical protein